MIVGGVELNQGFGNGRPLWGPGAEPRWESGRPPQKLKYKQIGWAMAIDYTRGRFSISSDPMIKVILIIYFNYNPALTPLQKRPLQLAKLPKNTIF